MRMRDEVFKLMTFKKFGINVEIPAHLKEEFDARWSKFEVEQQALNHNNKLLKNPLAVEKYKIATLQRSSAEYVLWEDYKLVVEYLQQQLSRVQSEASAGRYDSSTSWRD